MAEPNNPDFNNFYVPPNENNTQPPSDYNPATLLKHKPNTQHKSPRHPQQNNVNSQAKKVHKKSKQTNSNVHKSQSTSQLQKSSQSRRKKYKAYKQTQSIQNNKNHIPNTSKQKSHKIVHNNEKPKSAKQKKEIAQILKQYKQRRKAMIEPPKVTADMLKTLPISKLYKVITDYSKKINKATYNLRPKSKSFKVGRILDGKVLRGEESFTKMPSYKQQSIVQYHKWQNKKQEIQQHKVDFANKIKQAIKPRVEKYYRSITVDKANQMVEKRIQTDKKHLAKHMPTADVLKYGKNFAQKTKKGNSLKDWQYKEANAYKQYKYHTHYMRHDISKYTQKLSNILKQNAKLKKAKIQKIKQEKAKKQPSPEKVQAIRHKNIIKAQAKLTNQLRDSEQQDKHNSAIYNAIHGGFLSIANNMHMKRQVQSEIRHDFIAKRTLLDKAYQNDGITDDRYKYTYSYGQFKKSHEALKERYKIKMSNPQIKTNKQLTTYCKQQFYKHNPQFKDLNSIATQQGINQQQAKTYRHQQFAQSEYAIPVDSGMQDLSHLFNYYQGTALNRNEESVNDANKPERLSNIKSNEQKTGKFNRFLTHAQQRAKFCCRCISTSPAFTRLAKGLGFKRPTITKHSTTIVKPKKRPTHLSWRMRLKQWNQEQHKEAIAQKHYGMQTAYNLRNIYRAKRNGTTYSQYETPQTVVVSHAYHQFMKRPNQANLNVSPNNHKSVANLDKGRKVLRHHHTIHDIRKQAKKLQPNIKTRIHSQKTTSKIKQKIQRHQDGRQR